MIHEETVYTILKLQTPQARYDEDEEKSPVKHAVSRFSVRQECQNKTVTPGGTDISGLGLVSYFSRSSMHYTTLTLHNLINLLNVVSTNSFSRPSNFTSLTKWCTNELR